MGDRLEGKVAIVTGGARGQGGAEATLFRAEGAEVVITDVLREEGELLAKEIGATFLAHDVRSEEEWAEVVRQTVERHGRIDVLVNNAGIFQRAKLLDTDLELYRRIIDVNQIGVFLGMKAVAPAMKRADGGSIINISSVEGLRGLPRLTAYSASKFAVRGMSKSAAVELGKHKIRVNSIHPGFIDTPMTRAQGLEGIDVDELFKAGVPMRRAGTPDDIVNMVVFLASDESTYCTGAEFIVDGGATSFVGWGGHIPRFS